MPVYKLIPILLLVLISQPASACIAPSAESTIFFDKIPSQSKLKYDLAAVVKIEGVEEYDPKKSVIANVTAIVTKVLEGKIRVGDRIRIQYAVSSCGPNHGSGSSGLVFLKRSVKNKHIFLPYAHNRDVENSRIYPPEEL